MRLPNEVTLVEVGPRDGLQNIADYIETDKKIELVNALSNTGVRAIEVISFVHPKAVPQFKDAEEVMRGIVKKEGVMYKVLIPNLIGASRAIEVEAKHMNFVLAASETFNKNNVRKSIEESLEEFAQVINMAREANISQMSVSIATAFGCPFEGKVPEAKVMEIINRLRKIGATEIILADTTGMANPLQVAKLLENIYERIKDVNISVHFHNTRGAGLANILAALQAGVTTVEGSIGGLGGCPFAPGATGNVATEDVANMLQDMNIELGINLPALIDCAKLAQEIVGQELPGQVMKSGPTYG